MKIIEKMKSQQVTATFFESLRQHVLSKKIVILFLDISSSQVDTESAVGIALANSIVPHELRGVPDVDFG